MSITGNGLMYGSLDNRGLIWTSYSGYFNADVNFFSTATTLTGTNGAYRGTTSDLTSTSTATNGNIVAGIRDGFSIQFLGYFFAPQSGTYTWSIASDDRSYLWIGPNAKTGYTTSNAIFFDNWDIQNNPVSVLLTGGIYYPIRIQYGDNAGPDSFSMYFTLPGSSTPIYNGNDYYFNDGTLLDGVLLNASVVVTPFCSYTVISVAAISQFISTDAQMYLSVKSAASVPTTDNTTTRALTNTGVTIVTDATRGKVLYFNGSSWFNTNYLLPITHTRCFWVNLASTSSVNNTLSTLTRPINFNQKNYINTSLNYNSTSGVSTSSISLSGTNQYASLGSGTYYEYTTGTVEAWIKTTANVASWQGIVNKIGSWYGLYLYGNVIVFWNVSANVTTSVTVNDGNWHHVALSFQTGVTNGFNIYIDGVLNTSFTYNSYTTSANSFIIGSGSSNGSGQNFSGNIDEVRIWNIALTATQIAAYYNVRISPTTTGLTGYWYMDEGSGTTLNNAVSGGPAFTLYNSTFSSNVCPVVNYRVLDITNTVTTSSWNFYAVTYDGTTAKLYKNGNLDVSVAATSTATPDTLQIGAYNGGSFLNGYLDNIRCYNTVLTQAQIQAIYNYELANPTSYYNENASSLAFTPTTVSGIQLWLDANDNTTLQLSSTTVNQWNDKSGKGYNATQYGLTTAVTYSANGFNKLPAISFTSGQGLIANSPSGTFSTSITLFAVFSTTGSSTYTTVINKTNNNLAAPFDPYNQYVYYGNGSSSASTTGYNLNTLNTLNLFSISYNVPSANNITIQEYLNGTSQLNFSGTGVYGDTVNNIYIGLRADRVTTFVGVMSEIIVYNTNLTTTQRQNIEGYLAQKWGLLGSLPSNHPYYPITITNNNFTTPGGATNTTVLANAGSTTAYGWTFNSSTAGCYFHIYYCSLWSAYYTFPSQYTYNVDFQFYLNTGTMYMTQSITFPANGTYILTLWATPFGQNLYNTNQKLSAYIDSTQVITNWTGVTSSGVVIAQLLTSIPFTVTAGTHTLKLQSDCLTNTINSTIEVTGININLYVS